MFDHRAVANRSWLAIHRTGEERKIKSTARIDSDFDRHVEFQKLTESHRVAPMRQRHPRAGARQESGSLTFSDYCSTTHKLLVSVV